MTQIRRFTGWNLGRLQTVALRAPEVTVGTQHLIKPGGADVAVRRPDA